jgi:hypothetical protein
MNYRFLSPSFKGSTPLLAPTTSTHKKKQNNTKLMPKVSHLHKPMPSPLMLHKSPYIQLNDKIKKWFLALCVATPLWPSVGVKPNTPKVGDLESSGTPECLEFDSKAQNYSH